jgi:hypothetical protein
MEWPQQRAAYNVSSDVNMSKGDAQAHSILFHFFDAFLGGEGSARDEQRVSRCTMKHNKFLSTPGHES